MTDSAFVPSEDNRALLSLPAAQYHAMVDRMSSGGIARMLRSPAHYRAWRDHPTPPTPAMMFGTVVHTAVLEPEKLEGSFVAMPDDVPDKRYKEGKAWWAEFNATNAGRIVLTAEQAARVLRVRDAMLSSPAGNALLQAGGLIESTMLWTDDESGVPCKCRPDYLSRDRGYVVDVKTSTNATQESFAKSIAQFGYHLQAQLYRRGIATVYGVLPPRWLWLVVETEEPFGVAAFNATARMLAFADARIADALTLYRNCIDNDYWPGYEPTIRDIDLPAWAYRETINAESIEMQ
jgi:exodeoxyribonuclease VIII